MVARCQKGIFEKHSHPCQRTEHYCGARHEESLEAGIGAKLALCEGSIFARG